MVELDNPILVTAGLAVAAAIVLALIWLIRGGEKKRRPGEGKGSLQEKDTPPELLGEDNCLVVSEKIRSFDLEYIPTEELQKVQDENSDGVGRQWVYEGHEVYYLFRNKEGKLSPVKVPQTLDMPPSLLYEALQQEDTEIVFDVSAEEGAFAKYGPYLIVAGIAAFVIIATMQRGG